ncbi:MAG: bifunctional diaminohydroxyphosphoribosylaminopyrimidine deaminase/5-amino-6-(5-phosphoribosylamino)uracil reductase RibD [Victivallaceae bacterium]|nr:bifunctional diaminohydroxyphosphoribosylaminopyrimidine deaminase/5-amino-6-(5-phosphoribosylamino)uracil reductase RibD [Victivallaceae bacterium]
MTAENYMLKALELAKLAWGRTSPNPLVGAVLVKDRKIIGQGYHRRAGEAHAEINALREAGENARGADLYVTLEPCSTSGRTPPCTDAIIAAGIKKVFAGSTDPNPAHAGKGLEILVRAGIETVAGIEKSACDKINEAFFTWITGGRPFVLLKLAMTLDGKIATVAGRSHWITGVAARQRVQTLRQWCDAIMVGGETVRQDRPELTVRGTDPPWEKQPLKLIATRSMNDGDLLRYFPDHSARAVNPSSPAAWRELLTELGRKNITALLIEGGGELAAEVLNAGIVDQVEFHIAPKILGGKNSRPAVAGKNPLTLEEAKQLRDCKIETAGNDIIVSGYLAPPVK